MITARAATSLFCLAVAACQQPSETPAYTGWNTRTTGAEQPSARAIRTSEAPSVATVTSAPPITTLAAMIEDERVDPSAPLPPAPAEPAIAPAVEQQARSLQALVARTAECWSNPPYARIAHSPPPECEQWFATLTAGGEASGIAIGRQLAASSATIMGPPLDRLSAMLAAPSARAGLPMLLRRAHATASVGPERATDAEGTPRLALIQSDVSVLEGASGFPLNATPAWVSAMDPSAAEPIRASVTRALRFWSRYGARADWAALSEQRLRLWLAADEARVIRAAQLILRRSASASLEPDAKEALQRVVRTSAQSSPRAIAQSLLGMIESPNRAYR